MIFEVWLRSLKEKSPKTFRHYITANLSHYINHLKEIGISPPVLLAVNLTNKPHQSQLSLGYRVTSPPPCSAIPLLIHYPPIWIGPHPSRTPQSSLWIQFVFILLPVIWEKKMNLIPATMGWLLLIWHWPQAKMGPLLFFFFSFLTQSDLAESTPLKGKSDFIKQVLRKMSRSCLQTRSDKSS